MPRPINDPAVTACGISFTWPGVNVTDNGQVAQITALHVFTMGIGS